MRSKAFHIISSVLLLLGVAHMHAQDLASVGKEKPIKVSGGINATTQFYDMIGAENRRDPFLWQVGINLNVNAYGVDMPFSATFSRQQSQFAQPFNQYGLSPHYKWLTVHLGWRSLNFSPYTLGGNMFLGAGVEVDHEDLPVKVTALYGRFAKAIDVLALAQAGLSEGEPAFERIGYGAKVSYPNKLGNVDFIFFKGEDDKNSITRIDSISDIRPAENLVLGLTGSLNIKKIAFSYELARSFYTSDIYQSESSLPEFTFADNLGGLLYANTSTSVNNAIKLGASRNFGKFQVNLGYNRVDPNYQTMGAPFLNNDIQNITAGLALPLFKNKVNLNGNVGFERDNLDGSKRDQMNRVVVNSSLTWAITSKWSSSFNFSNFNTNSVQVAINEADSILFFQVTRNLTFSTAYQLGSKTYPQSVSLNVSLQETEDLQKNNSNNQSYNLAYNFGVPSAGISTSLAFNYFVNNINPILSTGFGPSLSARKSLLDKKASLSLAVSNAQALQDGERNSNVNTARLNFTYSVFEGANLGVSSSVVNRAAASANAQGFTELRGGVNLSYSF